MVDLVLSFGEVVILKSSELIDVLTLKLKFGKDAYLFSQGGYLGKYIYTVTVFSSLICLMDDQ